MAHVRRFWVVLLVLALLTSGLEALSEAVPQATETEPQETAFLLGDTKEADAEEATEHSPKGGFDSQVTTNATQPSVTSVSVAVNPLTAGATQTFTVKTSASATHLRLYAENNVLVKTWTSSAKSAWTVSLPISVAGDRTLTFKASTNGSTFGTAKSVSFKVIQPTTPAVTSVTASVNPLTAGATQTFTVKTSASATHLRVYAENNVLVKTWTSSAKSAWTVTLPINVPGNRTLTFKASANGSTFGTAKSVSFKVIQPTTPNVTSVTADVDPLTAGATQTFRVITSASATHLRVYAENNALVKTWTSSATSSWTVTLPINVAGNRTLTFKASANGSTFGGGKGVSFTVQPQPVVYVGNNSVSVAAGKKETLCMFVAPSAGKYTFTTTGSKDTVGTLYNASKSKLAENDDGGEGNNFRIEYTLTNGQTVYIGVKYYSSSESGTVTLAINSPEKIVYVGNNSVSVAAAQETLCKFVAPSAGTYVFTTTGSKDTVGTLYNASKSKLTENDDGGEGNNFRIEYTLTNGQTVYIGVKYYRSSESGTVTLVITRVNDVPNPPTNVTATAQSSNSIKVTWTKSTSSNVTGYKVYYGTSSSSSSASIYSTYSSSATSATINGLSANTRYYVWVKATSSVGDSAFSNSDYDTTSPNVSFTVTHDSLSNNTLTMSSEASKGDASTLKVESNAAWSVKLTNNTSNFLKLTKSTKFSPSATIDSSAMSGSGSSGTSYLTLEIVTTTPAGTTSQATLTFTAGGKTVKTISIKLTKPKDPPTVSLTASTTTRITNTSDNYVWVDAAIANATKLTLKVLNPSGSAIYFKTKYHVNNGLASVRSYDYPVDENDTALTGIGVLFPSGTSKGTYTISMTASNGNSTSSPATVSVIVMNGPTTQPTVSLRATTSTSISNTADSEVWVDATIANATKLTLKVLNPSGSAIYFKTKYHVNNGLASVRSYDYPVDVNDTALTGIGVLFPSGTAAGTYTISMTASNGNSTSSPATLSVIVIDGSAYGNGPVDRKYPGVLIWPARVSKGGKSISSPVGPREPFTTSMGTSSSNHHGTDIAAYYQSDVMATADGYAYIGGTSGGYGNYVIIDHQNGFYSLYAHMSGFSDLVTGTSASNRKWVNAGDVIGYVGYSGSVSPAGINGTHLHFELAYCKNGKNQSYGYISGLWVSNGWEILNNLWIGYSGTTKSGYKIVGIQEYEFKQ